MKLRYIIAIPSIYPPYTGACLDTLNPKIVKHTMVIDNTKYNRGVAASWNLAAREVVTRKYDYLIIVSAAMRFHQGFRDFIDRLIEDRPLGLDTPFGWHCIALSRKILKMVGPFDEHFYPAYYEDSDYIRRMELSGFGFAGVLNPGIPEQHRLPKFEVAAECIEDAHGLKRAGIQIDYRRNKDHFVKKWGAEPAYDSQADRDRLYQHPFNNPDLPLHFIGEA